VTSMVEDGAMTKSPAEVLWQDAHEGPAPGKASHLSVKKDVIKANIARKASL